MRCPKCGAAMYFAQASNEYGCSDQRCAFLVAPFDFDTAVVQLRKLQEQLASPTVDMHAHDDEIARFEGEGGPAL